MGKPNKRHHEKCQQYKAEGRREKNKAIKAKKNEARIEKFAKRREERKTEEEKNYTPKDPETRGSNKEPSYKDFAWTPKQDKMDPVSKNKSFGKRIQNQLDAEIMEGKKNVMKSKEGNKENDTGN